MRRIAIAGAATAILAVGARGKSVAGFDRIGRVQDGRLLVAPAEVAA